MRRVEEIFLLHLDLVEEISQHGSLIDCVHRKMASHCGGDLLLPLIVHLGELEEGLVLFQGLCVED